MCHFDTMKSGICDGSYRFIWLYRNIFQVIPEDFAFLGLTIRHYGRKTGMAQGLTQMYYNFSIIKSY